MPKIAPTSPLYAQFRQDFPAQAGEGITGDLNYSDTIVPIVDMTSAAGEGLLAENLQTAWDFSTGFNQVVGATSTIISNTGFWKVDLSIWIAYATGPAQAKLEISDGTTSKTVYSVAQPSITPLNEYFQTTDESFVVFLRSGDSLVATASANHQIDVWYRQIADLNGNPTNPQGFSFN